MNRLTSSDLFLPFQTAIPRLLGCSNTKYHKRIQGPRGQGSRRSTVSSYRKGSPQGEPRDRHCRGESLFALPLNPAVPVWEPYLKFDVIERSKPGNLEPYFYAKIFSASGTVSAGLILYQAAIILPFSSTRKEDRIIPSTFLPYMVLLPQTPY
jgi:hypothetical protein